MPHNHLKSQRLATLRSAFAERFRNYVRAARFPCVGAKSALNRERMEFGLYDRLSERADADSLRDNLARFSQAHPGPDANPVSYVAMFRQPVANEDVFHDRLWEHLQLMHDVDARVHPWNAAVSANVEDPQFSFSVAERAFFVVGLHPQSSRLARQAPFPCLVFNFHDQFEAMRASGAYDKLKGAIRARDVALQGAINPVLATFGEGSEARQYSGRADLAASRCPFHARTA